MDRNPHRPMTLKDSYPRNCKINKSKIKINQIKSSRKVIKKVRKKFKILNQVYLSFKSNYNQNRTKFIN